MSLYPENYAAFNLAMRKLYLFQKGDNHTHDTLLLYNFKIPKFFVYSPNYSETWNNSIQFNLYYSVKE